MNSIATVTALAEPKAATHTLRVDIVNQDGTVKRLEINFSNADKWAGIAPGSLNVAEMLEPYLYNLVASDKYSVGCQLALINNLTGNQLPVTFHPRIVRPEFIIKTN